MEHPLEKQPISPRRMALRLALTYALTGGAWIVFSDLVLGNLGLPSRLAGQVGTAKGIGFVVVTSVVLYLLSHDSLMRVRNAQEALRNQELRIREAYVDVLDAVTGGRLLVLTERELADELGKPLTEPLRVSEPRQLSEARASVRSATGDLLPEAKVDESTSATSEALDNAIKHAGGGWLQLLQKDHAVQVKIADQGGGIDFRTLPKATLTAGFSTTATLGMGFTIMLQFADRVLISTGGRGTTVVLEFLSPPASSG